MPPVPQYPKSTAAKDVRGAPVPIPEAFVISMLPPPSPSSRRVASSPPLGLNLTSAEIASSQRRPTPPPLPNSEPPVVASRSNSSSVLDIPGKRSDPPSELELLPEFRPRLGLPHWARVLGFRSRALFARLMAFDRRKQLLRPIAIAGIAALLGWGVGAKPWAPRHGLQSSSAKAPPKPNRAMSHQSAASAPHNEIAATRARASAEPLAITAHGPTSKGRPKATPGPGHGAKIPVRGKPLSTHSKAALAASPPHQAAPGKSNKPHVSTH